MQNQIFVSKGSANLLTSYVQKSLLDFPAQGKGCGSKREQGNTPSKHKRREEESQSGAQSGPSATQPKPTKGSEQNPISETLKRKLMKAITNTYEYNLREFTNAAWAYLDIPEDLEPEEGMYCFNLLFGPENRKHTLFRRFQSKHKGSQPKKQSHTSDHADQSHTPDAPRSEPSNDPDSANSARATGSDGPGASSVGAGFRATPTRPGPSRNHYSKSEYTRDDIPDLFQSKLRSVCTAFFERHGLVVKIRKLPLDYVETTPSTRRNSRSSTNTCTYPSYHFISRQRRHLVEQVMRSRSFFETEYNGYTETRNFRSPFLLFPPHPNFLKYLQDVKNDLNDNEFTGLFISLSTLPHESDTELGTIKRSKLVAWSLIEILTNNERCLKCLWVNPLISANGTTDLLRAFLPFIIISSFAVKPPNIDDSINKLFYVWLADFDLFPRQALVLLTSPYRFALEKHFDYSEDYQDHLCTTVSSFYSKYLYENNIDKFFAFGQDFSHTDSFSDNFLFTDPPSGSANSPKDATQQPFAQRFAFNDLSFIENLATDGASNGDREYEDADEYMDSLFKRYLNEYTPFMLKDKKCHCYNNANWNDVDKVILSCSEQMMIDSIPRWLQLIRNSSSYLEEDLENLVAQRQNDVETSYEIRMAEFTKLENNHIQDLLTNLYGSRWNHRLKVKYVKIFKAEELTHRYNSSPAESEHKRHKR